MTFTSYKWYIYARRLLKRPQISSIDETVRSLTQTIDDGRVLMPTTRRRLEQVKIQLTNITQSLDTIFMRCIKEKLNGDVEPRRWEWLRKSGKVTLLLQEVRVVKDTLESTLGLELFQNTGVMLRKQEEQALTQVTQTFAKFWWLRCGTLTSGYRMSMMLRYMSRIDARTQELRGKAHVEELNDDGQPIQSTEAGGSEGGTTTGSVNGDKLIQGLSTQLSALSVFGKNKCRPGCDCLCHTKKRRRIRNPAWTRCILGSFEALIRQGHSQRCMSELSCACLHEDDLYVEWRPPRHSWTQFLFSHNAYPLSLSLRPRRMIPWRSNYWVMVNIADAESLQEHISSGEVLFPDDTYESGTTLVQVSMARVLPTCRHLDLWLGIYAAKRDLSWTEILNF
jgi:hypothetical protein